MAALSDLLHLRHHLLRRTPSLPLLLRRLSTTPPPFEPQSEHEPNPNPNPYPRFAPFNIQPVSYPVIPKPKPDPNLPSEQQSENSSPPPQRAPRVITRLGPVQDDAVSWTREDIRYVKDNVAPTSYRVAPLPEDRVRVEGGEGENVVGNEVNVRRNEELEMERRRIEEEFGSRRRVFRRVDEERNVPFPSLIKAERKKSVNVVHDLKEAIRLIKANSKRNFDETLEAHAKMSVDLRRTDLKLTGSVSLPHGSGKSLRVAVFAEGPAADEARAAGADIVGGEDLIEGIKNGKVNLKEIDKCIATFDMMKSISKISRKLNRLVPNSRDGSVTNDISRTVKLAKNNTAFKKDRTAIVHVGLGKVSNTEDALCENVGAFVNALLLAKPAGLKKSSRFAGYLSTFHICSTMGPSYPVSIQSLSIAADRYSKTQLT